MDRNDLVVGRTYTYWPQQNAEDNLHFPAEVLAVGKRVKVRVFKAGADAGVIQTVSAKRLADQHELIRRGGGDEGPHAALMHAENFQPTAPSHKESQQ